MTVSDHAFLFKLYFEIYFPPLFRCKICEGSDLGESHCILLLCDDRDLCTQISSIERLALALSEATNVPCLNTFERAIPQHGLV